MPKKIITIGSATFDIFVKTDQQGVMKFSTPESHEKWLCLKHGGKITLDDVVETFGGGATNTAVSFARKGFDASFVGKIGAHYGDRVIENLEKEGVHTDYVKMTSKDRTAFSTIISTFDGDRTVLLYPGANRLFDAKDLPVEALEKTDWIFLNHVSKEKNTISQTLLSILQRKKGAKLAWNPGHEQLCQGVKKWKALLNRTEILFLNKEEAAQFTGVAYKIPDIKGEVPRKNPYSPRHFLPPYASDVRQIFKELFKYGVKYVVITDGASGAQASDGKRLFFSPVVSRKRVDTLGAGDGFASGFTTAIMQGKGLKTALLYGTLNANAVVSCYGAQKGLLTLTELKRQCQESDIKVSSTTL